MPIPIIMGIGFAIAAIGTALGAPSCGDGGKRRKDDDGKVPDGSLPDGRVGNTDANIPPDGGRTRDAGDGGNQRDGNVDTPDGGPRRRRGINDNFAKLPCSYLADLDVVGDKLVGLCRGVPLKLFQCQTTTNLESSVCASIATLPEMVGNRRVTPTFHRNLNNHQSLITFTSQGDDSGVGVFLVDRNTGDISETFSFRSAQYIGAGGTIEVTPLSLNSALIYQNQLLLATQSNYDVSEDNLDPFPRGQIFAIPFTEEGHINTDLLSATLLATGHDNPLHFIIGNENTILSINGGGRTQSGIEQINIQTPPQITQSNNLGGTTLKALPNLAVLGDGNTVIMSSADAPWKLLVVDIANRRVLQERNTPEIVTGVVDIVLSAESVFVTDTNGHLLWFELSENQIGRLLSDVNVAGDPGPAAIHGGLIYQSVLRGNARLIVVDPRQLQ